MQQHTDLSPATAQPPADPGTGTGPQASTQPEDTIALYGFTVASIRYLEAQAAHHRADATMYRALAAAHRADPYMAPADRALMSGAADQRAETAEQEARDVLKRALALRAENPAAGIAAADTAEESEPTAIVVITIQRNRIQQTARLLLGAPRTANRTWRRGDLCGSWATLDRAWSEHEDNIGIELAEYMDALDLPDRVADMLPRPRAASSDAAARAAEEVRRG